MNNHISLFKEKLCGYALATAPRISPLVDFSSMDTVISYIPHIIFFPPLLVKTSPRDHKSMNMTSNGSIDFRMFSGSVVMCPEIFSSWKCVQTSTHCCTWWAIIVHQNLSAIRQKVFHIPMFLESGDKCKG